jgi:hypothetical protein
MPRAERRPALGARKKHRPHPASPAAASPVESLAGGSRSSGEAPTDRTVMLCARVTRSLRQRIKLVAVQSGRSVQDLVAEALEVECRRLEE